MAYVCMYPAAESLTRSLGICHRVSTGYFASIYWRDLTVAASSHCFLSRFSADPHTIMSARSSRSATSSRHSNQLIRPRRLDPTTYFNRVSNQSRLIDKWLDQVCKQAHASGRPLVLDGSMPLLDYGPQVVICRVERQIHKVNPLRLISRTSMLVVFFFC